LNPAQIFGVEKLLGKVEVDKMANLIVAEGAPLEFKAECLRKRNMCKERRTVQHRERQRPSDTDRSLCSNARPLPLPLLYLMSRCRQAPNIAEFTPSGYYIGHKPAVTKVTAKGLDAMRAER